MQHTACEARQYVLRIQAPRTARRATPGSFVHLRCDPNLPMRRPLSIMRAAPEAGLDRGAVQGHRRRHRGARRPARGTHRSACSGPIGKGFRLHPDRPRVLAIGGGVGIPPMVFLAESLLADSRAHWKPLVLMGSEIPFPFRARPSRIMVPAAPAEAIACMPLAR